MPIAGVIDRSAGVLAACFSAALFFGLAPAQAADGDLQSGVVQVPTLDHQTIIQRATSCAARQFKPGAAAADVIVNSDPESGIVVARNAFEYRGVLGFSEVGRSTFTLEARDGRFRMTHSDVEWLATRHWISGVGSDDMRDQLERSFDDMADCVQKGPVSSDF